MILAPNSSTARLREFNPCHDGRTGRFAGQGEGKCQPVTPDKVFDKQRKYALAMQERANAEVALMIGPDGQQVPYPAKNDYRIANWLHEEEPKGERNDLRQTLKKEGYQLGIETSVMIPDAWRDAEGTTFIHTHPSGTTFSPGDVGFFGRSKAEAAIVFGPEGEWYEIRKTSTSDLSESAAVDLYDELHLARQAWIFDATKEVLRKRKGVGLTLTYENAREILIDELHNGDRKAALAAASAAVDHRPRFDRTFTKWADEHDVYYRSWLHLPIPKKSA